MQIQARLEISGNDMLRDPQNVEGQWDTSHIANGSNTRDQQKHPQDFQVNTLCTLFSLYYQNMYAIIYNKLWKYQSEKN